MEPALQASHHPGRFCYVETVLVPQFLVVKGCHFKKHNCFWGLLQSGEEAWTLHCTYACSMQAGKQGRKQFCCGVGLAGGFVEAALTATGILDANEPATAASGEERGI